MSSTLTLELTRQKTNAVLSQRHLPAMHFSLHLRKVDEKLDYGQTGEISNRYSVNEFFIRRRFERILEGQSEQNSMTEGNSDQSNDQLIEQSSELLNRAVNRRKHVPLHRVTEATNGKIGTFFPLRSFHSSEENVLLCAQALSSLCNFLLSKS